MNNRMLNDNIRETADDSSSEDENSIQALKEAADCPFFSEKLYSTKETNVVEEKYHETDDKPALKSLRQSSDDTEKFETFGASQSYRDFVAKKLDELLDRSIKLKNANDSLISDDRQQINNTGIKLLSASKEFLSTDDKNLEHVEVNRKRKKKIKALKKSEDNILTDLEKFQEAAVNPDWILSKEDTKAWTNKRNDLEFRYKRLKNGVLMEN